MFGTNKKNSYDHIWSDSWTCWHVSTNLDTINCLMMPLVKFDAFSSLQNTKIKERNYIVDYSTLFLRGFKLHFQTVQTDVLFSIFLACSRLSDSGEGAKVKRHAKSWRGGKKERSRRSFCSQFPPVLFSCLRFLNSADSTISKPGTGYNLPGMQPSKGHSQKANIQTPLHLLPRGVFRAQAAAPRKLFQGRFSYGFRNFLIRPHISSKGLFTINKTGNFFFSLERVLFFHEPTGLSK